MDILRAKEIVEILADGVNPMTGEILSEGDSCNQAEVVRAYLSGWTGSRRRPDRFSGPISDLSGAGNGKRRGHPGLLPLGADGQFRVEQRLRGALRSGIHGLSHRPAHSQGLLPLVPGSDPQWQHPGGPVIRPEERILFSLQTCGARCGFSRRNTKNGTARTWSGLFLRYPCAYGNSYLHLPVQSWTICSISSICFNISFASAIWQRVRIRLCSRYLMLK